MAYGIYWPRLTRDRPYWIIVIVREIDAVGVLKRQINLIRNGCYMFCVRTPIIYKNKKKEAKERTPKATGRKSTCAVVPHTQVYRPLHGNSTSSCLTQQHTTRVLNVFLDLQKGSVKMIKLMNVLNATNLDKESNCFTAIQEAVVVSQSKIHHLMANVNTIQRKIPM